MSFPSLDTFNLRFGPTLAGTPVRIDNTDIYEDVRTSRLAADSNAVYVGQIFQYDALPIVQDEELRTVVRAVDGTYTADHFAGFLPNREYETRERNIQPLLETPRSENRNIGRVDPWEVANRSITTKDYWLETDLAEGTVLVPGTVCNVLPHPSGNEGGIVSTAGGTPTPAVVFTGGAVKRSCDTGRNYAAVRIVNQPLV